MLAELIAPYAISSVDSVVDVTAVTINVLLCPANAILSPILNLVSAFVSPDTVLAMADIEPVSTVPELTASSFNTT